MSSKRRSPATGRVAMLRRASNLGVRGLATRFDVASVDRDNSHAVHVLKKWGRANPGQKESILLYGPVGTGKTHLACCAANDVIDEGLACIFLRVADIPRADSDALAKLWDPGFAPRLVLDDLGSGKATPRLLECLFAIIDGRAFKRLPTIYTSNFKLDALADLLDKAEDGGVAGTRLASRLAGSCELVPLGGEDRRK